MLNETRFPPKGKLPARRTDFFMPTVKQLVAGACTLDRMPTRGTLHTARRDCKV